MFGCLGKAISLLVLLAVAAAAWLWGPGLWRRYSGEVPGVAAEVQPSPELADRTLDRLEAFRAGEAGDEIRLGDAELSSMARYALPGVLPPGVDQPTVRIRDGHLHLSARVALAAFPDLPSLSEVVQILPDTVPVEIRGTLTPFDRSRAALHVDRIEAARIPLPARMIPDVLRGLGRRDLEGLPPDALVIPLPEGLGGLYILRDSLVLVGER